VSERSPAPQRSEGNTIYSVEAVDIVKPAGISTASISENRRNYVAQAGFEEKLQRKIDEIKGNEAWLTRNPAASFTLSCASGQSLAGLTLRLLARLGRLGVAPEAVQRFQYQRVARLVFLLEPASRLQAFPQHGMLCSSLQ